MAANRLKLLGAKLVVNDLDRMAAFYTAAFGLTEMGRVRATMAGRGYEEALLRLPEESAPMLVLQRFDDPEPAISGESILDLGIDEAAPVLARIAEAGGAVLQSPEPLPGFPLRLAFARDPEGHLIELVEGAAG